MKKLFALLISVMLCFCFVACTTTPVNKSEISSVLTESETSSFASSDSATTSSEPTSSKSNSTSSKSNSTSSKNTSTSSKTTVSSNETSSKGNPSKPVTSGTSSITIPNELMSGIVSRPSVKEEDKVSPITTSSKATTSSAPVSKVTPLLYSVTGENGTTVYLFGSIHVGKKNMYPLPDYVLNAFNLSDSLAVECYAESLDEEAAYQLAQAMLYTDGTKVSNHITSGLYSAAKSIMLKNTDGYAENIDTLDYFKAIYWSSIIDGMTTEKVGFESQYGIDNNLIEMAVNENKRIIEIESVLEQYQMLGSFSEDLQEQLLYASAYNYLYPTDYRLSLTATYDAWCNGDYEKLREHCTMETEGSTDEETALLTEYNTKMSINRDKKMTEFVVEKLKGNSDIFVCVGSAHIVGENAIVDQLKDLGYTVTQITKDN